MPQPVTPYLPRVEVYLERDRVRSTGIHSRRLYTDLTGMDGASSHARYDNLRMQVKPPFRERLPPGDRGQMSFLFGERRPHCLSGEILCLLASIGVPPASHM